MADGYDLEIDVDLDDDPYQRRIKALVSATKKYAADLEKTLTLSPRLETKSYQAQFAKLNGQKLKEKKVMVDADTAKATSELRAFTAREEAQEINKRVDVNTSYANAQLLTFSRGIEQTFNRLGSIGLLGGAAGVGLGAVGAGLAGFGLATAAKLDQAQFGFERLMGGAQAAAPILRDLKTAALNTPFDLNDVLTLAFRLKSAGRASNGLAKDATVLADALAATGGGAQQLEGALFQIQQLQGRSKILEREDLRTLNNQIPGFMAAFKKLFGDKREFNEPQKAMEAIFAALQAIPGAAGAAAAATEQTFSGRFSKFKDVIQISFAEAFLPQKETLFKGLDTASEAIQGFLKDFAPVGAKALSALADAFTRLIVAGGPIVILFTDALPKVLSNFVPLVEKGANAFERLGITSDQVAKAITGLLVGGAVLKLGGMILGVVTPILTFVTAIGPLAAKVGTIFGTLSTAGSAVGGTVMGMVGAFSAAGGGMSGLAAAGVGLSAVLGPVGWVIAGVTLVVAGLVAAIATTKGAFSSLASSAKKVWEQIQPGLRLVGSGLKDAFVGLVAILRPVGILFINLFKTLADWRVFEFIAISIGATTKTVGVLIKSLGSLIGLIGKIPGLNKVWGDSSVDLSNKISTQSKKITDAQRKQNEDFISGMRKNVDAISSLAKANIPALDLTNADTIRASGQAQIDAMKTNIDNIRTVVGAGYSDLVVYANDQGTETGIAFITTWAQAIKNSDTAALDALREQLLAMEKLIAENELLVRLTIANSAGEFIKNIFGTGSSAALSTELGKAYDDLVKNSGLKSRKGRKKDVDNFIKNFAPNLKAEEEAALRKQLGQDFSAARKLEKEEREKAEKQRLEDIRQANISRQKTLDSGGSVIERPKQPQTPPVTTTTIPGGGGPSVGVAGILGAVGGTAELFVSARKNIADGFASIKNIFMGFPSQIAGFANSFFNAAQNIGSSIVRGITNGISGAAGSIGGALSNALKSGWNAIAGKVNALWKNIQVLFSKLPGPFAVVLPNFEIPRLASGTNSFGGGLAIVGEYGPELVNLPRGSKVTPAHKTREAVKPVESRNDTYNINVNGVSFEDAMARMEAQLRAKRRQVMA